MPLSTSLLQKQQMHFLLTVRNANSRLYYVQRLSEELLAKVEETSKNVAVLKSANMSLGINTLMKLLQDAAKVLATAGFDMEIVEKHHRLKLDAPSGTALALADSINEGNG